MSGKIAFHGPILSVPPSPPPTPHPAHPFLGCVLHGEWPDSLLCPHRLPASLLTTLARPPAPLHLGDLHFQASLLLLPAALTLLLLPECIAQAQMNVTRGKPWCSMAQRMP